MTSNEKKKGFAITFDAMLAFSILFIAAILVSWQTFQPSAPRSIYLKQITMDALTVMEKTGRIGLVLSGNSSAGREILEATGESICIQISIIDSTGTDVVTITKANCGGYGKELQTTSMSVIYGNDVYLAKAESWYKK